MTSKISLLWLQKWRIRAPAATILGPPVFEGSCSILGPAVYGPINLHFGNSCRGAPMNYKKRLYTNHNPQVGSLSIPWSRGIRMFGTQDAQKLLVQHNHEGRPECDHQRKRPQNLVDEHDQEVRSSVVYRNNHEQRNKHQLVQVVHAPVHRTCSPFCHAMSSLCISSTPHMSTQ